MKNGNTGSDKPEENPELDAYEAFLNFVEGILNESISANVRNKNYNLFSRLNRELNGNIRLLGNIYKIEASYNSHMVGEAIRKRKKEILTGGQLMIPVLQREGEEYKTQKLIFVSKKDTLGGMRERVGEGVRNIFGKGTVLAK